MCQGVLPYLEDSECAKAVSNMGAMCRGFLFIEAVTARDLLRVCDRTRTDTSVRPRAASFYRRLLARDFEALGCGLFHAKSGDAVFYELERAK